MKELELIESVNTTVGNIEVKPYLTYAEIQAICDAVMKFDSWAERQENIDILLLHFATNLTDKELEDLGHTTLLESGLIDEVKQIVKNYDRIQEAIDYSESTQRTLSKILKELPDIVKPLKDVANHANKSSKK